MFKVADRNSTFAVELSTRGKKRVVAFRPGEERALTVGADIRADFRVSGTGVAGGAAIQFHLERRDGMAWLVPAYGVQDLRVNTARVTGPLPLEERNVIEFGEVRIDLEVVSEADSDGAVEHPASDRPWELDAPQISDPPGTADATLVAIRSVALRTNGAGQQITAMERSAGGGHLALQQTERMAPHRASPRPATIVTPLPVQGTERMSVVRNTSIHCGPNDTEIIAPSGSNRTGDLVDPPPTVRTGTQTSAGAAPPPLTSSPIVPMPILAVTRAPTVHSETTSSSQDGGSGSNTPLLGTLPEETKQPTTVGWGDRASDTRPDATFPTSLAPWSAEENAVHETPHPAKLHSWLEKLGMLAKARPILVACGVMAGAFILASVLVVVTRLARHRAPACIAATSVCSSQVESRPRTSAFDVELRVRSDDGEPLAGATWTTGETGLGQTGIDGALRLTLRGREGQSMHTTLGCPAGYQAPVAASEVRLTHAQPGSDEQTHPLKVDAVCFRSARDVALIFHAVRGPHLPLLVDGKAAGSTDADGNAHLLLRVDRSVRKLDVGLDTSARPELSPKSPARSFELGERDAVLVFAETFSRASPAKPKTQAHARCVFCPHQVTRGHE